MASTVSHPSPHQPLDGARPNAWLERDLRRMGAAATAGLVVGGIVGGVGGRLAMMLLARLNPEVTGRISDDGFRMGQFDLGSTLGLVVLTAALGVVGGLVWLAIGPLRFGPRWFQLLTLTVGPAVVIGAGLVHQDGIDFHVLEPVELAIALFVLLPGLCGLAMTLVGDRWVDDDSWFLTGGRVRLLSLFALLPAFPALPVVFGGFVVRAMQQSYGARRHPVPDWFLNVMRVAATVLVGVATVDLVGDIRVLVR